MRRLVLAVIALGVLGAGVALAGAGPGGQPAADAARAHALTPLQKRLVSGTALRALEQPSTQRIAPQLQALAHRTDATGCPRDRGSNLRVNQDCQNLTDPDLAGRGEAQNETATAQDPNNPRRIVAAANDYRRGDSNCYTYHSDDGGRSWEDSTPPTSFTRGAAFGGHPRQYWQAAGDPTVAWDTRGNAYLTCLMFDRGSAVSQNPDQSSAFYVYRSTGTGGASWNFPGRPVDEFNDAEGEGEVLLDKEYMAIDDHRGSPFRDRIYVTWTRFDADGTSYIYLASSSDYGETFSEPRLVSGDSALCSNALGLPTPQGRCNTNQFSQPFTGPDGNVYVTWANYNVTGAGPRGEEEGEGGDLFQAQAVDNRSQMLLARSTDGGETFSAPVKVGDFYDLPDCETYQDGKGAGSGCVPEKGATTNSFFRAANYPSGAVDPRDDDEVVVTYASYINRHSQESNGCVPEGYNPDTNLPLYDGVKTAGACNNDIVVSRSTDAGGSFTGGTTDVRELPSARANDPRADQFWQWAAFSDNGRLAVSYYDRAYGNDEQTGFSDVSLSGSRNSRDFATARVTTGSMPPPTEFAGGFFGDYSGLTADDVAHPVWMDTRDAELFACLSSDAPPQVCTMPGTNAAIQNDQNIFTRSLAIPLP
jgi:hypothetical protein